MTFWEIVMFKKLSIVLALLIFSGPAWGEQPTIKQFLEEYDSASQTLKQRVHDMFRASQSGMHWSNAFQKKLGGKELYCKPIFLKITGEQAFQIFRDNVEMRKKTNQPAHNTGMYLLNGLMKTFPCL